MGLKKTTTRKIGQGDGTEILPYEQPIEGYVQADFSPDTMTVIRIATNCTTLLLFPSEMSKILLPFYTQATDKYSVVEHSEPSDYWQITINENNKEIVGFRFLKNITAVRLLEQLPTDTLALWLLSDTKAKKLKLTQRSNDDVFELIDFRGGSEDS